MERGVRGKKRERERKRMQEKEEEEEEEERKWHRVMRYQSYRDVPSTEDKHQRHPQFMFLFLEYNSITSLPYIVSIQLVQYDLLVSFSVQSTRTASTTKPDPNSFIRALIGNRQNLRPHDQSRLLGSQQHHPLLLRRLLRLRLQPPHPNPAHQPTRRVRAHRRLVRRLGDAPPQPRALRLGRDQAGCGQCGDPRRRSRHGLLCGELQREGRAAGHLCTCGEWRSWRRRDYEAGLCWVGDDSAAAGLWAVAATGVEDCRLLHAGSQAVHPCAFVDVP